MKSAPNAEIFNALVWEIVKQIPSGKVATYGQIASMLPPMDEIDPVEFDRYGAQWVGAAMNATPDGEGIPWQRVLSSKGTISLPEGTSAAIEQRKLLEAEGVVFDTRDRINFEVVGWDGPDDEWLELQELKRPTSLKKKKPDAPEQPKLL